MIDSSSPTLLCSVVVLSSLSIFSCSSEVGGTDMGTGGMSLGAGGAASGGSLGLGASSSGGAAAGGSAVGGSATGGALATGGSLTGGASTGGASTGGASTGGVTSAGGVVGTGGALGGGATGGASASGGFGSGGEGTGGSGGLESLSVEQFFSMACGECHGDTGDGIEGKGPDIKHPVEEAYSTFVIRNGRSAADDSYGIFNDLYEEDMSAFPEVLLPEARLREIYDFLSALPQPTTGEGLYLDYCAACHGNDAAGGLTDRPLNDVNESFLSDVRDGHHPGEYGNRHEYMPVCSEQMLSDAEVAMIEQYVAGL